MIGEWLDPLGGALVALLGTPLGDEPELALDEAEEDADAEEDVEADAEEDALPLGEADRVGR